MANKSYSMIDFLKDINTEKKNLLRLDPLAEKDFSPYLINRNLANFIDCIFYVSELNIRPNMDKKMQYDYLINGLKSRKRFAKTPKPQKEEDVELVQRYYNYDMKKALEAYELLSDNDLEIIRQYFVTGGKQ